jgi:hypothetical protein
MAVSLGDFSKMKTAKRLLLLTSDGDKLETRPHIRTTQTDKPLGEPQTTKRSTERMAVVFSSKPHLFACDGMEAGRFSPCPHGKSYNCQGDVGQQTAFLPNEKNLAEELNNASISR